MLTSSAELQCQYLCDLTPLGALADQRLATVLFDIESQTDATLGQDCIKTGLKTLTGVVAEVLLSDSQVTRGHKKNTLWARTENYLLLALSANELELGGLQQATESLYTQLFSELQEQGYPHLVRVWNYFANINRIEEGLERYRQFCVGRFNAFDRQSMQENQYPSACALGHGGGELLIYVLASKKLPIQVENPRQASAYHYPPQYGPRSPSFARASLLEMCDGSMKVFVSGTASVIGHATAHPDNLQGQIQVTLGNLSYLLAHISEQQAQKQRGTLPSLLPEVLKVYVRYPRDLFAIQEQIAHAYPDVPIVYVAADICRADLLLEIDGVWNLVY